MVGHKIKRPVDFDHYSGSKMQKFRFSVDCIGCRYKITFTYERAERERDITCPICGKKNPVEFIAT